MNHSSSKPDYCAGPHLWKKADLRISRLSREVLWEVYLLRCLPETLKNVAPIMSFPIMSFIWAKKSLFEFSCFLHQYLSFVLFFAICNFAFIPIFQTKSILPIFTFSILVTIVNVFRKLNVSDAIKKNKKNLFSTFLYQSPQFLKEHHLNDKLTTNLLKQHL